MICDQFRDDLELYALGALESAEALALAEHLATGCALCQEALKRAIELNGMISRGVPLVEPPARLRRRVKESVAPSFAPRGRWLGWAVAAAALVALAVGLNFGTRLRQPETVEQARLASVLQILGAPGTRQVSFTDARIRQLHGALYIHQKLGLALIIDRLPAAPAGWKYESWVVPKAGAPQPVEPFHPDSGGRAVSVVPGPVNVDNVAAVAVSMEPLNSRPTKPTTLVFAAKLTS